jgi:DNA repair protein RadC
MKEIQEQKIKMKALAEGDRPREKLLLQGRRALSDAELLAIIIGCGNLTENAVDLSKRVLSFYVNDLTRLSKATANEFLKFKGIGTAKAVTIIAALELGLRRKRVPDHKLHQIISSKDAELIIRPLLADLSHEEFWIILLNRGNLVIGHQLISRGGQAGTVVDPKIIFKVAIEQNAAYIILAHNHPSGNLVASAADISITKKLVKAGSMLELPVLDHIILTDSGYLSLADSKLM